MKAIQNAISEACREKIERDRKRGILNRPVRAMVVGIPNVENPPSSTALPEKPAQKRETSQV